MAQNFEIKTATNGKFHFNLLAGNGQIILSSQMYATRTSAENGIDSVRKNSADDTKFARRESSKGAPYFVLKAGNGQEIGRSQMYKSASGMENGIQSVRTNAPSAEIADKTSA